jgi:hypothetical protein
LTTISLLGKLESIGLDDVRYFSTFAVFAAFCKISSFLTEGSEESKGS